MADNPEDKDTDLLLDLSTAIPKRATIAIDGKLYEFKVFQELTLKEQRLLQMGSEALQVFSDKADKSELTPEEAAQYEEAIRRYIPKLFVQIPDDVVSKLFGSQLMRVIAVFPDAAGFPKVETPPPAKTKT